LRKGKYHYYKLDLLQYLVENNFIIKIGEDFFEITQLASTLGIPMSSWYDITRQLENSGQILMRRKTRSFKGIIAYMVYEIQLTQEGLKFLTRFRHA
jgi:hypothetical protein